MLTPQIIDHAHVERRYRDFVAALRRAMTTLGHDEAHIVKRTQVLATRLAARDFKRYGLRPVDDLHGGKRITRFEIRCALQSCPAQRRKVAAARERYHEKCAVERKLNPHATFFSFEAANAKVLQLPLAANRKLFYI